MVHDIRVFVRRYRSKEEAIASYEKAAASHIGHGLNVSFFGCFYRPVGWIVATVGEDAAPWMLEGGEEFVPDPGLTYALLLLRITRQLSGDAVVRVKYLPSLAIRIPGEVN